MSRDTFPPAGKSQPLGCRRLHGDTRFREAGDFRETGADRIAMGRQLRCLADEGRIDMGDLAAARPHAANGMAQENVRRRAFPRRVGRWKVEAYVGFRQGTVERVGNRMQEDIGIGMADEAVRMRDFDTAERDVMPLAECMDIIA